MVPGHVEFKHITYVMVGFYKLTLPNFKLTQKVSVDLEVQLEVICC